MPRLLYVITSSAWGGAERYVARLANAAAERFETHVAAGGDGHELFSILSPDVRAVRLRRLVRPIAPFRDLLAVLELRALIDREGFDLVHANSSKAGLIASLAAACSRRKPLVVYTAHGWGFFERRSMPFRLAVLWSEKLASRWRRATIVLSEVERTVALRERLAAPERLHRIPLGIDAEEIAFLDREAARAELEAACGRKLAPRLIGTIANAYPSKGLPMLVRAFNAAVPLLPETDLVVIGDGPEMRSLRALHASLPYRDRIHLPGALPGAARMLKALDLFTLASLKEGLPWTILEASLAGVPIVATRVGALPEIIVDGETGMLLPPGDVQALSETIVNLLTRDRGQYQRLVAGAPRIAEGQTGAAMLHRTLQLYRTLLA